MPTIIAPCTDCRPHAFQDAEYGQGIRVHNTRPPKIGAGELPNVCTVCGKGSGTRQKPYRRHGPEWRRTHNTI